MRGRLKNFLRDDSGVAAIELAGVGVVVAFALMNVAEVGRYAYQTTEVNAAAQAGAQAAQTACDAAHVPALTSCDGLNAAVAAAIQSTPLKSNVTLDGAMTEAYYCVDGTGQLKQVASSDSKPADCSAVSNSSASPTLYLQVHVKYAFAPIFPGLTLTKTFDPSIKRTSWMRMA